MTEPKRIAVDFDKTLTDPDGGTYFTEEPTLPNNDMIVWVNERYKEGHTIIIHTARPWSEAMKTVGKLTEWGVRWHGIRMDKGSADLYVDDKSETPDRIINSPDKELVIHDNA